MRKTTMKRIAAVSLLLVGSLAGIGCNKNEDVNRASVLVTVVSLLGQDVQGALSTTLASDVITCDESGENCSFIEDPGTVEIRVTPLNPDQTVTSNWQDVVFTRYKVRYSRPGSRNVPGEDVPYAWEGALTVNCEVGATTTFGITLVRAVAKSELPLVRLWDGAINEDQILTTATVDFYGQTLAGDPVTVTGYITIHFANWADQ